MAGMAAVTHRPRTERPRTECEVCGEITEKTRLHYGGITCYSCRAFFRRSCTKMKKDICKRNNNCEVREEERKRCGACRYVVCINIGMKPDLVLNEEEKQQRFKNVAKRKADAESLARAEEETDGPEEGRAPSEGPSLAKLGRLDKAFTLEIKTEADEDGARYSGQTHPEGGVSPPIGFTSTPSQGHQGCTSPDPYSRYLSLSARRLTAPALTVPRYSPQPPAPAYTHCSPSGASTVTSRPQVLEPGTHKVAELGGRPARRSVLMMLVAPRPGAPRVEEEMGPARHMQSEARPKGHDRYTSSAYIPPNTPGWKEGWEGKRTEDAVKRTQERVESSEFALWKGEGNKGRRVEAAVERVLERKVGSWGVWQEEREAVADLPEGLHVDELQEGREERADAMEPLDLSNFAERYSPATRNAVIKYGLESNQSDLSKAVSPPHSDQDSPDLPAVDKSPELHNELVQYVSRHNSVCEPEQEQEGPGGEKRGAAWDTDAFITGIGHPAIQKVLETINNCNIADLEDLYSIEEGNYLTRYSNQAKEKWQSVNFGPNLFKLWMDWCKFGGSLPTDFWLAANRQLHERFFRTIKSTEEFPKFQAKDQLTLLRMNIPLTEMLTYVRSMCYTTAEQELTEIWGSTDKARWLQVKNSFPTRRTSDLIYAMPFDSETSRQRFLYLVNKCQKWYTQIVTDRTVFSLLGPILLYSNSQPGLNLQNRSQVEAAQKDYLTCLQRYFSQQGESVQITLKKTMEMIETLKEMSTLFVKAQMSPAFK